MLSLHELVVSQYQPRNTKAVDVLPEGLSAPEFLTLLRHNLRSGHVTLEAAGVRLTLGRSARQDNYFIPRFTRHPHLVAAEVNGVRYCLATSKSAGAAVADLIRIQMGPIKKVKDLDTYNIPVVRALQRLIGIQ